MPLFTCDMVGAGLPYGEFALEIPLDDRSGYVLVDCRFDWDGVSIWPQCDGPVIFLRTRNTGTSPAWALLPDKKRSPLWVQIDPGTDKTITSPGQLANLGLSNALDARSVRITSVNPAG